ncbi:phosphoglycolate phosphatase [Metallibacterium scheffleri]|uniref:phosphoglycolate phosphatase n=1 Tax=Metallibacterium scheffleri TaxID=993689 RepID=UPI0023F5353C|nr:phosphoglycolate phosphatase [Metallibacterium scheffleri]
MIEVLSFDLDGTLVDTGTEIAAAVNLTLRDFDRAPLAQAAIEALIGAGAHELMRRVLARVDAAQALDHAALMQRFEQHYAAQAGSTAQPYPDCVATLQRLRAAGLRLACVTNKEQRHAQRVLDATALAPYFELLIGGDTLAWKKPDARVLRHVVAALGSRPVHAAHVGDSQTDLAAARNAGVADWAVPWGYNAGTPIAQARPTRLFDSFAAIAAAALAPSTVPPHRAAATH